MRMHARTHKNTERQTHKHGYSQAHTHTHIYLACFIKKKKLLVDYISIKFLKYFKYFFHFRLVFKKKKTLHISMHFRVRQSNFQKTSVVSLTFLKISRFAHWLLSRFAYSPGSVCLAFLLHFF